MLWSIGVLCCQTNIPPPLKFINASLSSLESKYETDACKYAFMVDVVWFGRLIDIYMVQSMPSVPAVLDWRLSGNCGAFGSNMSVCGSNAYCFNQSVCICSQGYQGNPYLPRGCLDIDECASPLTNACEFSCTNIQGSYRCSCPNGYSLKGKLCTKIPANNKWKTILIGCLSGFGVLLLLFVAWWAYKMMKRRKEEKLKDIFFKRNGGILLQQQMSSGDNGNENRLMEIIDPRVKTEGGEDQIKRFAELANRCLNLDGRRRPRMKQVAIELELIRTSNEAPETEVEDDSIKQDEIWNTMSIGIESGPIITSSSSDTHPLLL
ncbi:hypothetical protein E3N88_22845 [Mikania micrantha]|uniref:EGF-like domain-containing protein n=1 Tax=Mikania micrantha TaxID=192012 RepID=A0A5N6NBU2_9ASTR|nr:hypothetical protein E3N88_22845 [Mikania micrantha]